MAMLRAACMRGAILLSLTLVLAVLPSTTAAAPPLSPATNILYAHYDPDGGEFYMNTLAVDGDDANVGTGAGPGSVLMDFTWSIPLKPVLASDVVLDAGGDIVITAYVGGNTGIGQFELTTELASGGTVIATGEPKTGTELPATVTGSYETFTWTVKPEATTLAAGKDLVWTLRATGTTTGTFLGMSEGRGRSNVQLPVASSGPAVGATVYKALSGATATIEETFPTATTATYVYNWTTSDPAPEVAVDATVQNGTVDIRILDAANATVYSKSIAATGTDVLVLNGAAGAWRIEVDLKAFQGTVKVTVTPKFTEEGKGPEAPGHGGSTPGGSTPGQGSQPGRSAPEGSEEDGSDPAGEDAKSSPSPALGVVLALVAIAAMASRRRW
jgi:hypothetical protein